MSEQTKIDGRGEPLRILAASALRSSFTACAKAFSEANGASFAMDWGTSGAIAKRIGEGEAFDLVASAQDGLVKLAQAGLVRTDLTTIGVSRLALGIRAGAKSPDISSVQKFRDVLLAARMISRGDPAGGGTAGNHLLNVFMQLGVLELIAAKSILRAGGFGVMQEVAQGNADFGLTQSTEISAVEGVEIGAFLPAGVQLETVYAIAPVRADCAAAQAFLAYLDTAEARHIITGAGFAPA